ncbi:hypothetical protein C8A03DRAFT_44808 [Achaetomium macrosporum]|uniref:Uncharacterized protein n=1 Tax=Achaetomium macrosporum TaxID=79813 RepID=A0AAN7C8R8_9PEZI|nr:hypothetical protein C8A03DRAFT_44808 [Achaetomium macrosporum]
MASVTTSPLTCIPPLRDGACGTTPRLQQPLWSVMRREMGQTLGMMPTLFWANYTMLFQTASWAGIAETMLRLVLACLEMGIMLAALPLWLMLPGAMFAMWLGACAGFILAMCWMLNGKEQMYQCSAGSGSEGWMMGQEAEDEKWMFLGGMGMSSRHCHKHTLPTLSRLFGRSMVCICMPTYGMPFDTIAMMLQRCVPSQLRCAVLDDSMNRCVVLCHNDSAVIVSQAVAQLCADVPMEKLRKLEIYTFGAAAAEFMMPLGDIKYHQPGEPPNEQRGIHLEHFAMKDDPFAQVGVLHSVRQNMEGRFCGGVFLMNKDRNAAPTLQKSSRMAVSALSGLTMEEYLIALFPAQMMPSDCSSASPRRSVLDSVMNIDKDCAEKREIAAMSNYHSASRAKKGGKRLSWTGLAAMAGHNKNGMGAGMVALEMARKGCRNCEGRRDREVSWLARYVSAEERLAADRRPSP